MPELIAIIIVLVIALISIFIATFIALRGDAKSRTEAEPLVKVLSADFDQNDRTYPWREYSLLLKLVAFHLEALNAPNRSDESQNSKRSVDINYLGKDSLSNSPIEISEEEGISNETSSEASAYQFKSSTVISDKKRAIQ